VSLQTPDILIDLRQIKAFSQMPEPALRALVGAAKRVRFKRGAKLVSQSEVSPHAYALISGVVTIVNESAHGAAPIAIVEAPALVGEIGTLTGLPRTAGVVAATPVIALRIDEDVLKTAAIHAPDVLIAIIAQLGGQIRTINDALGLYATGLAALERDELDLSLLEELTKPTPALANFSAAFGQLAHRIAAERRSRNEMASAALIQRAMLPPAIDEAALRGRGEAHGEMRPAREVGGDFYDLFMLDDDRLVLAIGDACGKGVPASLFMSMTVTMLRLAARQGDPLAEMIAQVNDLLVQQNAASMFTTLFYGVLDLASGRLEYVNCAHSPPMVFGPGGAIAELAPGGAPLGLLPGRRWPAHEHRLAAGEGLLLFTDGITEAPAASGEEYGEARLKDLLARRRKASAAELVRACIAEASRFSGELEQFDDITCVAARRL
jgi:serine phosphatase RsbU (regulator of sigma subunit)